MTYMDISQLGPVAGAVVVVIAFLKYLSEEGKRRASAEERMARTIDASTQATRASTAATEANTQATIAAAADSKETLTFMRNLNGELRKAAIRKLTT